MKAPVERPLTPTWLRLLGLTGLGSLLAVYAWWPMFMAYPKTPELDGRHFFFQFETVKAAIRTYHELPLWNPFDCHGIPLWNHPESMAGAPLLLLTTMLSTTVSMMLWQLVHVVVGFVSMWLLARDDLKLTRMASFIAATMWACGCAHTTQYGGAHETLVGFLYAPLLLLLWRKAETSWNARVGTGLVIALLVFEGATYPLPFTLLMLGLETLTRLRPRTAKNIVLAGLTVGLVAIMVSAVRLLPLADELSAHKRAMEPDFDHLARLQSLVTIYTLRSPHWLSHIPEQQYVFGEYLTYIGWLGLGLVLVGVSVAGRKYAWLVVLSIFLLVFMLGHFARWAPFTLLQAHVFPFTSMRVPSRFRLLLLMNLALFVGLAVDRVPLVIRQNLGSTRLAGAARVALVGLAFVAAGDAIGLDQEILSYRFNGPPEKVVTRSSRFYYGAAGLTPDFIDQPRQNEAWLGCRHYTWAFESEAPVWPGDVPQARAQDDGATVTAVRRTHNTFTLEVDASRPTRILLNSAWDRAWRTDVGAVVENTDKLLAIDVPPGRHTIHARFWPNYMTLGFVLSGLGTASVILFFLRHRLRRRAAPERVRDAVG